MRCAATARLCGAVTTAVLTLSVVSCRCGEERVRPFLAADARAGISGAMPNPRLVLTRLPSLDFPLRGRLADLLALDDGGYVVADVGETVTIRRFDSSMKQQWEYAIVAPGTHASRYFDMLTADDLVWVAITFGRTIRIDGVDLTAVGTDAFTENDDLLLLVLDLETGQLRSHHQMGDHAIVDHAQLANADGRTYLVSSYLPASRGEREWGRIATVEEQTGGLFVAALSRDAELTWSKRIMAGNEDARILADGRRVAVASESIHPFEIDGHPVSAPDHRPLWVAEFSLDGSLQRVNSLEHPEYWLDTVLFGDGDLGYLMGGRPPTFGILDRQQARYQRHDLPCSDRRCLARAAWRVPNHLVFIVTGDNTIQIDLVSAAGDAIDSETILALEGPSEVAFRPRGDGKEMIAWRGSTNVVLRLVVSAE